MQRRWRKTSREAAQTRISAESEADSPKIPTRYTFADWASAASGVQNRARTAAIVASRVVVSRRAQRVPMRRLTRRIFPRGYRIALATSPDAFVCASNASFSGGAEQRE